ncbi:glucans biosynthesis glucosyltransferase MdoH [Aurantimonas sp. A2-1-M11]|uniref:glucans biosynthesis glucosyltransferase MdoH n=1 Tax=Aurantimonas sp. A2-1-M11 TaxID=3113712 RepID=UPI002F938EDD
MLRIPPSRGEARHEVWQDRPIADAAALPPIVTAGWPVALRRWFVAALNLVTICGLAVGVYVILSGDGIDALEAVILAGFALATPWTVLGFWNAVIGLCLLHGPADPAASVYPFFHEGPAGRPTQLASRTAIVMTLRNEAPEPSFERLEAMKHSLAKTGLADRFRFFILSDTDDAAIARREEEAFAGFASIFAPEGEPVYRRRRDNTGFKAGNIAAFLADEGAAYDYFLPLDSDSVMSGDVVVRMVAAMERHPRLGLLQSLVVGMPANSGFARIFQFGMRHGMRSFTMGAAWWNADCGSYWGHNAVIRTEAFRAFCRLPDLPGRPPLGGPVLSHDQLEAAFMRRSGYEVRVIPVETRSYETNPPTLPDFAKRDLRWCQGNMQYWRFLFAPGLAPLSRFQVLQAILMYLAPPAWLAMTIAACAKAVTGTFDARYVELGLGLFVLIFLLSISPKIAGALDVMLTRGAVRSYGGPLRFAVSTVTEIFVSMLLAPVAAVYVTIFLAGLPFGRSVTWSGQNRDVLGVGWGSALRAMWPQTLFGSVMAVTLFAAAPLALVWSLPFVAGLLLAVPFTVMTAMPALGRFLSRAGLFAVPEESALPLVLKNLVPATARRWRRPAAGEAIRNAYAAPVPVRIDAEIGRSG